MGVSRKSISVQSQMCGDTQIVVLVIREQNRDLKRAVARTRRRLKRAALKFGKCLRRNWLYILIGLWLTWKAIDAAYEFRGYRAIGGEYLVLPMFLALVVMIRKAVSFIEYCREG